MKKYKLFLVTILSFSLVFSGCSFKLGKYNVNNFSITEDKPFIFYYTNELAKNITLEPKYKCSIIDTNFFSEKTLSSEDCETIHNFIKALRKNNYIQKPADLPSKPDYKIYFTFSKEKYVVDVYNERYLTVYPWDGNYPADYLDMNGVYKSYNLFSLCKYLISKQ